MTYQAKAVLRELKELSGDTDAEIAILSGTTCFCLSDDFDVTYDYRRYQHEIGSILDLLADESYLSFTRNKYHFRLTQKAIHCKQITLSAAASFLSDKCIDILALIVAILAFLNSYGYDVLAPLFTLCTKLSELRWP